MQDKKFVIGIGTGRCGTVTLSTVLSGCKGCNVKHEFFEGGKTLPWEYSQNCMMQKCVAIGMLEGSLVGDVASYYLNYVEHIPKSLSPLKVVHIYRNKNAMVKSFMAKTKGRNNWGTNAGLWNHCFPTYDLPKQQAIEKYYDEYMEKVEELKSKLDVFEICVTDINHREKRDELFDFLEIPADDRYYNPERKNVLLRYE